MQTTLNFKDHDYTKLVSIEKTNKTLPIKAMNAYVTGRKPNPGVCRVISIDFEKNEIVLSNGAVRFYWDLSKTVIVTE